MNIQLLTNNSPKEFVTKNTTDLGTITGSLREGCSLLRPRFEIAQAAVPSSLNYVYIPDFGRYYYARVNSIRTGLWELECEADPLMSWATQLRACKGIVHRSEDSYNVMLDDGSFRAYADPEIRRVNFPNGFSTWEYLLVVAGGANSTS